ncbi:MAG TPA: EF-hand domain-containing protein [Polyangiales bacterium]
MTTPTRPSLADAALLESLERSFTEHAQGAEQIDVAQLQKALGLRSEFLARRVLGHFDQNGDGVIDRQEFVAGVRKLVFGSDQEKLLFAFHLHDNDDDGAIGPDELHRMIALSLAEDQVVTDPDEPRRLAHVLFMLADKNRDGRISFDEFQAVVNQRPELLGQMTRSEARWIAPNEDLLARLARPRDSRRDLITRWLGNRWRALAVLAVWVAINAALFAVGMLAQEPSVHVDAWTRLGRALGTCMDFDGALILIPVMRRLLTRVRAGWLGRVIPIDEALDLHRLVGHTLAVLALAHAIAFSFSYQLGHPHSELASLFFRTERGFSGLVLLLLFAVMWAFALAFSRRSQRFEWFYFSHLLYVAWFILALMHAPAFAGWVALPLLGWGIEQWVRLRSRARSTKLLSAQALRSGVSRLEIQPPPGFVHRAGDYVFLRVPTIARHEWHPFTLSSAPEDPALTVHVRTLGNWTSALRRRIESDHAQGLASDWPVHVDGPYGSPSTHIFESRHAVLIGAGIGVTPFASVLQSLVCRANGQSTQPCQLEKVHFFWLNRDQYAFEWFDALLKQLETTDHAHLLDIHICMTGGHTGASSAGLELARGLMHAMAQADVVTGLRTLTHMGHPDWDKVLQEIAAQHAPDVVDVYFCGPAGLGAKLRPICERFGMRFREEQF